MLLESIWDADICPRMHKADSYLDQKLNRADIEKICLRASSQKVLVEKLQEDSDWLSFGHVLNLEPVKVAIITTPKPVWLTLSIPRKRRVVPKGRNAWGKCILIKETSGGALTLDCEILLKRNQVLSILVRLQSGTPEFNYSSANAHRKSGLCQALCQVQCAVAKVVGFTVRFLHCGDTCRLMEEAEISKHP